MNQRQPMKSYTTHFSDERITTLRQAQASLRQAADYIDAIIEGKGTQAELARTLGRRPQTLNHDIANSFCRYIASKVSINEVEMEAYLEAVESPYGRLLKYILDIPKHDKYLGLDDASEQRMDAILVDLLNRREYDVVQTFFGFHDTPCNLEATGRQYGITRERVRQMLSSVCRKLRQPMVLAQLLPEYADYIQVHTQLTEINQAAQQLRYATAVAKQEHAMVSSVPEDDQSLRNLRLDFIRHHNGAALSIRTYNCLMRDNKKTLGDIVTLHYDELSQIRNLGKKSCMEVCDVVRRYGYQIAGSPHQEG